MSNKVISLQQGVVADLVTISTNPSVPPIAAQALAGYHIFTKAQSLVPSHLLNLFCDQLRDELNRTSINTLGYDPAQRRKLERYTRALELLEASGILMTYDRATSSSNLFFIHAVRDAFRQKLSSPHNLNEAFLSIVNSSMKLDTGANPFTDYILSQEPIPSSQVNQWRLRQVLQRSDVLYFIATIQKWEKVILKTLSSMPTSGEFTLQEIVAIHVLHKHYSLPAKFDWSSWNESNSNEESHPSAEVRENSRCFLALLTVVRSYSTKLSERLRRLYLLSSKE